MKKDGDLLKLLSGLIIFLMIFAAAVMLSGCSSTSNVKVEPLKRPTLDIVEQSPIILTPVRFHIQVQNNIPSFCLSTENFSNLSNNMEKIQNHLDIQKQTIEAQKHYYESLDK